jgi:hypothetical protein
VRDGDDGERVDELADEGRDVVADPEEPSAGRVLDEVEDVDVDALPTVRDSTTMSVPLFMAALAGLLAIMALLYFAGCFSAEVAEDDTAPTLGNLRQEVTDE